jgi:hypothetical protein
MRTGYAFLAALSLSLTRCASGTFHLKDQWIGSDFFLGWNWETSNDPTHGRVNYVSQTEAISKNLTYSGTRFSAALLLPFRPFDRPLVNGNKFVMRADDTSFVSPSARGRDSIRISSENAYDDAIVVLDLEHMPTGCATWPAFWTLSKAGPWPNGGEIDIIEGTSTLLVSLSFPFGVTHARAPPPMQALIRIRRTKPLCTLLLAAQCPLMISARRQGESPFLVHALGLVNRFFFAGEKILQ